MDGSDNEGQMGLVSGVAQVCDQPPEVKTFSCRLNVEQHVQFLSPELCISLYLDMLTLPFRYEDSDRMPPRH